MPPTFNGETFGDFVAHLLQATQGKVYLILDNAKCHKAKVLKDFFIQNQDRLERIFLPPYSPELNPAEGYGELPAGSSPTTVISLRSTNSGWL